MPTTANMSRRLAVQSGRPSATRKLGSFELRSKVTKFNRSWISGILPSSCLLSQLSQATTDFFSSSGIGLSLSPLPASKGVTKSLPQPRAKRFGGLGSRWLKGAGPFSLISLFQLCSCVHTGKSALGRLGRWECAGTMQHGQRRCLTDSDH